MWTNSAPFHVAKNFATSPLSSANKEIEKKGSEIESVIQRARLTICGLGLQQTKPCEIKYAVRAFLQNYFSLK